VNILQHDPTYTIGKRETSNNFKVSREELLKEGAEIFTVRRGGETTFHGPGQV
jgi:lipoyl(octanoyl) transferase